MSRGPRLWKLPESDPEKNSGESTPSGHDVARDGPRRLTIPDQEPVSEERRSRRLNLPADSATEEKDKGARRLSIPEPTPEPSRSRVISAPPAAPAPAAAEPSPPHNRSISPPPLPPAAPERQERPKTKTDLLIEKASQIEPSLQPIRLRGRIDTILLMSMTDLLDWGNRNLDPLQQTSAQKARIASEIARIDPTGWLERTKDASCKQPSFLDRFSAKPPSFYEGMLQKTRAELLIFAQELDKMKKDFFREITDLHLDAISLMVCADEFDDDQMKITAHNRSRTLLASHQTAAVLQHTIEQSLMLCADSIHQIDSLLSVTIPNWKIAYGS